MKKYMRIAHISDIHANYGSDFNNSTFEKAVKLLNGFEADLIFISGDLTTDGLLREYEFASEKLSMIKGKKAIVPGNHDEKNLGYKLFPEFFGNTDFIRYDGNLTVIGLATSEPDKADGRLGRNRHRLITRGIEKKKDLTIIGFHHHLVPIPNSGREHNIIEDAGETLDIILRNNVPLVLMGHRHVPYAVKIHNTLLVNAGTFSCNRTRAHFGNTFNIIDFKNNTIIVTVINVEKEKQEKMVKYNPRDGCYINRYYDEKKRID
ncbi:MAG TPA: metallophosphoesterase [Candidatus Thermoplasmatota archaeon]|nr:metallophosphoesterase [Candidatus Thermoplasmatota archaeon]